MFDPVINALPAFASFFATAIGLLGGFLPAFAAARKGIVQAMREA